MPDSCRRVISEKVFNGAEIHGSHAGLLLDRYVKKLDDQNKAKKSLLEDAKKACKNSRQIYSAAFDRNLKSYPEKTKTRNFRTWGRLIVGLGTKNVLETGLSLHHTYGVPYIPGSALKGLAAHYCDQILGSADSRFKLHENGGDSEPGAMYKTLFGSTETQGFILFHDAWIFPDSLDNALQMDIMTPHHKNYYSSSGKTPPTDFDDPNPIPFLSVHGTFLAAVTVLAENNDWEQWAELALNILGEALDDWGVGGKTSSGYGTLTTSKAKPRKKNSKTIRPVPGNNTHAEDYRVGERITVTRSEDPKPKKADKRFYFKLKNGWFTTLQRQDIDRNLEFGESIEVVITSINETAKNLMVKAI